MYLSLHALGAFIETEQQIPKLGIHVNSYQSLVSLHIFSLWSLSPRQGKKKKGSVTVLDINTSSVTLLMEK